MRSHRWIVVIAVVVAALIGVAIAGIPHNEPDLNLRPLPTSTTAPTGVGSGPTTTTIP